MEKVRAPQSCRSKNSTDKLRKEEMRKKTKFK